MAGAHVLAHFQVVGQRQHAAGSYDDAVADDDRAVMQGRTFIKNRAQHFGDDISVHRRTGADDLIEVIVAFQHQQGTRAGVGQLLGCVADSDDGALPGGAQRRVSAVGAEQAVGPHGTLAHAFQRAAQFWLEDNDRRHKTDGEHVVQQPGHRFQVEHHSQAIRHDDKQDALDQLARAGFARKLQKLVKNKRYNDDIQCIRQRFKCTQTA